jgi:hypothetical protein
MNRLTPDNRNNQKGYGLVSTLVRLVFTFIIGVLILRFVFRMLGANPDNALVAWVYGVSAPLVAPFFGIFSTGGLDLGIGRLEFETLIALLVYGLIASLVEHATSWGGRHRPV